jgi:hypothetical protein
LILLPSDDIYSEEDEPDDVGKSRIDESCQSKNVLNGTHAADSVDSSSSDSSYRASLNSLFVNDCLKTYLNKKCEIKYKYHSFGGNYRQLPGYVEHVNSLYDKKFVLFS